MYAGLFEYFRMKYTTVHPCSTQNFTGYWFLKNASSLLIYFDV